MRSQPARDSLTGTLSSKHGMYLHGFLAARTRAHLLSWFGVCPHPRAAWNDAPGQGVLCCSSLQDASLASSWWVSRSLGALGAEASGRRLAASVDNCWWSWWQDFADPSGQEGEAWPEVIRMKPRLGVGSIGVQKHGCGESVPESTLCGSITGEKGWEQVGDPPPAQRRPSCCHNQPPELPDRLGWLRAPQSSTVMELAAPSGGSALGVQPPVLHAAPRGCSSGGTKQVVAAEKLQGCQLFAVSLLSIHRCCWEDAEPQQTLAARG